MSTINKHLSQNVEKHNMTTQTKIRDEYRPRSTDLLDKTLLHICRITGFIIVPTVMHTFEERAVIKQTAH